MFKRALLLVFTLIFCFGVMNPAAEAKAPLPVMLSIPSIGIEASIVPIQLKAFPNGEVTWDTSSLTTEVGHLAGTAWFGTGSNIVLGGHSELANRLPTVFYRLADVAVGDAIIVHEDKLERRYIVTEVRDVSTRDLEVLLPTSGERLTLITCDTESYNGGTYARRVVVIAEPAVETLTLSLKRAKPVPFALRAAHREIPTRR